MTPRRGFALLAVLWLIVALTAMVATTVGGARVMAVTTSNRLSLMRGRWAAEACVATAMERLDRRAAMGLELAAQEPSALDLGDGQRCELIMRDAGDSVSASLVLEAVGDVNNRPPRVHIELVVVPAGRRVAISGRRTW